MTMTTEEIEAALTNPNWRVRRDAVRLGNLPHTQRERALTDPKPAVRAEAVLQGNMTQMQLERALDDRNPRVWSAADQIAAALRYSPIDH